jgi:glycosyltransferase involved in cell wall biosynthesis
MVVSPKIVRKTTARLAPALSDVVISVSGAVRDHILQDNPKATNLRVLHNGIDIERIAAASGRSKVREEFGFSDTDVVAGTLARISKGKGQGYLVEAAALLADSCPNMKFLMVGDPFVGQDHLKDELSSLVSQKGLDQKVVLSPFRTDVPDILAACDICVLPSTLPDSFPTVVLESMAASRPVVATNWGGAKEMVVDGETGYLVPVDAAAVLADRLKILYDSKQTREDMGKAAYRRACELFTQDRMAHEFWDLMESVLAG